MPLEHRGESDAVGSREKPMSGVWRLCELRGGLLGCRPDRAGAPSASRARGQRAQSRRPPRAKRETPRAEHPAPNAERRTPKTLRQTPNASRRMPQVGRSPSPTRQGWGARPGRSAPRRIDLATCFLGSGASIPDRSRIPCVACRAAGRVSGHPRDPPGPWRSSFSAAPCRRLLGPLALRGSHGFRRMDVVRRRRAESS